MNLVSALWKRLPGDWGCLCTKSGSKTWRTEFFRRPFAGVDKFIQDNADKNIYFCPHLFSRKVRRKESAVLPPMLWADLDEVDPRKCDVKPTIAIESSPGRHVGLWMIDKPMTEELNKRLTYHLGADTGGWDLTQVLRVPRTVNYKYASMPRVRMMWDDGPKWSVADLERKLPERKKSATISSDGALEIYKKYEHSLTQEARSLMNSTPTNRSDRSAALWKIERSLIEAGATRREAFIYCRVSPWNKFRDRENGDEQLKHELDKGIDEKLEERANKQEYVPFQTSMADVEEEEIDWLWWPYLAQGEVTIIEGDPGVGKSYAMQMIAKAICDGDRLPSPRGGPPRRVKRGRVFYADVENSGATVTKKRLRMNGCHHMENFFQEEEPFTIDDEKFMRRLYDVIEEVRPLLIVFDTVNLYIGKADTDKASQTTQALENFQDIARRFHCSVVIVRHLTKGKGRDTKALYRGQGNIAFTAVSRIVMTVGQDPEDEDTKVLSVTKLNLAKIPRALTFTIEEVPSTLRDSNLSKFEWGDYVDLSSDDIIGTSKKSTAVEEAQKWLEEFLDPQGVEASRVKEAADNNSISHRTLMRAANALGIKREKTDDGDHRIIWKSPKTST